MGMIIDKILLVKRLLELFVKKNSKRQIEEYRIEKVINRKINKLYIKWKS